MNREPQPTPEIILEDYSFIRVRHQEGLTIGWPRPPPPISQAPLPPYAMAPTLRRDWLPLLPSLGSPSSGSQLSSSAPSLRSGWGLAAEACVDVNLEMRGLRKKMNWQRGKGGSAECGGAVIKHYPHFSHSRVFGKPLHDLRLSELSEMAWWAATWAFTQLQPISPIYRCNLLLLTECSPTSPPSIKAQ